MDRARGEEELERAAAALRDAAQQRVAAGRAGDASRAGLKKQLMAAKAGAVREQRKRELAEREAKKMAQQAAAFEQERTELRNAAASGIELRLLLMPSPLLHFRQ